MLVSLPGHALYFSWDGETLANASLKGIKTLVVDVDPPVRLMRDELKNYGVTEADLEQKITQRLSAAGFKIITAEQAQNIPEAALLKLRIRVIISHGAVYSYGLDLSLNQKSALASGAGYHSVKTWSTSQFGGMQQTSLPYLNNYSMNLVENFIQVHQAQN
jgi:hypothetical protein